jgi:uncharacterized membrane protein YphA (DoxX/SURF4 family)
MTVTQTTAPSETEPDRDLAAPRVMAAGLAAFRIFAGLVLLLNGLAKVFGWRNIEIGPYRAILINRPFARDILENEVFKKNGTGTQLDFLRSPAQFMIDNWGWFGWIVTAVEVGAGLALVFGIATRLGALVALGQQVSLALIYASSNRWLFEQPHEYVPLAILALVPTGRYLGFDGWIRRRVRWTGRGWRGWPF